MEQTGHKDKRIVLRSDAALLERIERIARAFFGGNRSELVRAGTEELLARKERELALLESERAA